MVVLVIIHMLTDTCNNYALSWRNGLGFEKTKYVTKPQDLSSILTVIVWKNVKSINQPILLSGMDWTRLSDTGKQKLERTQGNLRLNTRCHSSNLLKALNIDKIEAVIKRNNLF